MVGCLLTDGYSVPPADPLLASLMTNMSMIAIMDMIASQRVAECLEIYLQRSGLRISRAEAEERMFAKLRKPSLLTDLRPLLSTAEGEGLTEETTRPTSRIWVYMKQVTFPSLLFPIFTLLPHFTPLAWPAADDRCTSTGTVWRTPD